MDVADNGRPKVLFDNSASVRALPGFDAGVCSVEIIGVQFAQVLVCAVSVAIVLLIVRQATNLAHSSGLLSSADGLVRLYRIDNWLPAPAVIIPCSIGVGRGFLGRAPPESVPCLAGNRRVAVALQQRR